MPKIRIDAQYQANPVDIEERLNTIMNAATMALTDLQAAQWGAVDTSLSVIQREAQLAQQSLETIDPGYSQ